ncbi:transcriptional regulator [Azotobacter armeniacus]
MLTIIESPLFTKLWPDYWTEDERGAFMTFLASNPEAGAVIPGIGGCRKVRWGIEGRGKGATDNIPAHILRKIAKEMSHAPD